MYDIIYDYILNNIFNSTYLVNYSQTIFGVSTTLNVWLSHTCTIILMVLFVGLLVGFAIWLFKLVSGFILLR